MFDLPVETRAQRRAATQFRKYLLDVGYWMAQFSVYVKFTQTGTTSARLIRQIRSAVPAKGEVRIIQVTDRQWANGVRFANQVELPPGEPPTQLTIF